eukprot:XP_014782271.1 PREDICTED: membrane metallo-endopeptidase-like 1 [Octopus bimaculoides]
MEVETIATTSFKTGWSRMERVLFVLTLLLVICVLAVTSALVLVIFRSRTGKQIDKNATTTAVPSLNPFLSSTVSSSIQPNATRITGLTGTTHYTTKTGLANTSVNINSQPTSTLKSNVSLSKTSKYIPTQTSIQHSTYSTKSGKSVRTTASTIQMSTTKSHLNNNGTKMQPNTTVPSTPQPATTKQSNVQLCQTKGCVIAAARILQAMNMSVEPCTNFYQYACGDWIDTHPVKPYSAKDIFREDIKIEKQRIIELLKAKISRYDIDAVKKTKLAYESCVGIYYIKEKSFMNVNYLVQEAGGMPIVTKGWKANESLIDYMVNARAQFGAMPLIPVLVEIDQKNTSRNIIYLGAGSEATGKSITSNVPYYAHLRDPEYDELLSQVLKQFDVKHSDVKEQIDELSNFIKQLGILKWQSRIDIDDVPAMYHLTTLGEIAANYTSFDWKSFLQKLLSINGTNTELPSTEPIIVESPKYISGMMSLINQTNIRTLQNYIKLSTIMYYQSSLGIRYRTSSYISSKNIKNKYAVNSDERAEECYNIFTEDFKHVLGWMFVQKYFMNNQRNAVKEVTTITNYIINAVRKLLQDNKWLGETSKSKSLEKIQQLVKIIGFNAKTMTAQNVNEFFQGMTITANNFFRNIIQIKSKRLKLTLTELREKPSRKG